MTSSRRSGRHQRFAVALATAGCMALVAPATVPAATTVGQTAPTPGDVFNCGVASLFVQGTVAAPPDYVIPTGGGIITSWSVMGLSGGELKLKIVRRTAPNTYTIVAEDIQRPTAEGLNTFNTRIPVTGGELLALWVPSSGSPCSISNTNPGDALEFRMPSSPEPGIGQTFQTNSSSSGSRLNVSASLEADCDSDGLGDETQDPELTGPNCPPLEPLAKADRTLTLDANKNKVKKGKKVLLSGHLESAEQGCESAQTVELQRKRPQQSAFATFAQLQTDAQGNFSLKKKVKRTFEFRGQVAETGTCTGKASNTEKVKVKKKKEK